MEKTTSIHDAKIKTATIEIKNLVIEGRKLTLSAFRQIPEEDIIDFDSAKLKGVPWGYVNYFWKGLGPRHPNTIHIVWQKENLLRRAIVNRFQDSLIRDLKCVCEFPDSGFISYSDHDSAIAAKVYSFILKDDGIISCELKFVDFIKNYGALPQLPILNFSKYCKNPPKMPPFVTYTRQKKWEATNPEFLAWKKLIEEGKNEVQKYKNKVYSLVSTAAKAAYSVYVNNHLNACNNLVRELRKLDQLYIA